MLPFELTKDTPYLALSGELWNVFYEYLNRNWSCYKGFLLYFKVAEFAVFCYKRVDFISRPENTHSDFMHELHLYPMKSK